MSSLFLRFSIQEQVMFAKRLSILVKAGVPILEALNILARSARTRSQRAMFQALVRDVENGQFLSKSMLEYEKIFGNFAINIIRVGEVSGTLHENLNYLAEELKKKQVLRRKVVGAMVYPIFIVFATLGIAGMLTIYVFPKILPIFNSLSFELPFTTRALIAVSNFLIQNGWWVLGGLVGVTVGFVLSLSFAPVRLLVDRLFLKVPIFGSISTSYHMANLSRTLGLLLKSEVMIVEAAAITASTLNNLVYRRELMQISENLKKGEKISKRLLAREHLFPPMLTQMVTVGETTGNLSETLLYLSDIYEHEVDEATKNLTSLIEPVLMIFMGVIVGLAAGTIILRLNKRNEK